jgi:hypothetical protein
MIRAAVFCSVVGNFGFSLLGFGLSISAISC